MKSIKKSLSFILILTLITGMSLIGFTANAAETPMQYHIDYNEKASLSIYKYEMPDTSEAVGGATGEITDAANIPESATPLSDVTFTMYQVATLDDYFKPDGLKLPTVEEAEALITKDTQKYESTTDDTGFCNFTDLPLAIYLVKETDCPAQVTKVTVPFVLSLPTTTVDGTKWLYDVTSYPKNQTAYGGVTLEKVDSVENKTIEGAKFTLYSSTDGNTYTEYMKDIVTGKNGTAVIEDLPAQTYYQFVEVTAPDDKYIVDSTVSYDFYIDGTGDMIRDEKVVEDKKITVENDYPELHKYILDGEKGTQGIDNTANIGDTVYWEMTSSVPTTIEKLTTYTIVDTMSKGLQYTGSEVYLDNNKQLQEGIDYTISEKGLEVTFAFVPAALSGGTEIEIYFNTKLTEDAPLAVDIPNTSKLIYTNNIGTDKTYTTQSETPNVHTGGYSFIKTDGANPLVGAEFAIYKTAEDAQIGTNAIDTQISDSDGNISFMGLSYGGFSADEETKDVNGTANGEMSYWIAETKAPDGYTLLAAPIEVKVNAKSHIAQNNSEIFNNKVPTIPQTGSTMNILIILGCMLVLSGGVMYLNSRRKKSK